MLPHFHLTYSPPTPNWPRGTWSLYQITGDDIAARIIRDASGNITERWPWSGFIGCFETLAAVTAAIDAAMGESGRAS